jgi:hypothetical protein
MNPLPFISHRLFVAAVRPPKNGPATGARKDPATDLAAERPIETSYPATKDFRLQPGTAKRQLLGPTIITEI